MGRLLSSLPPPPPPPAATCAIRGERQSVPGTNLGDGVVGAGALPVFSLYFGKTKLTNRLWSEIFYTISVCALARGGWGGGTCAPPQLFGSLYMNVPFRSRKL